MTPPSRYRLYLDEAGDHRLAAESDPVGRRYLCLLGLMVQMGNHYTHVQTTLEDLKKAHLPYDPDVPPILHREDILNRRGPFYVLQDDTKRAAFDHGLVTLAGGIQATLIGVTIDKFSHGSRDYRALTHSYHYCLAAMLERYCGLLKFLGAVGDVLAEARGKTEDRELQEQYRSIWENGTRYLSASQARETLTTRELKIKPKSLNIAGLQIADVLAHPVLRDVLLDRGRVADRGGAFADRIIEAVVAKYNRQRYTGRIRGYGRILLT